MPINLKDYHPRWSLLSRLIRKKAGNKCEWCGVPNGKVIRRHTDGTWEVSTPMHQKWRWPQIKTFNDIWSKTNGWKLTKIVLTVAHLDQDKDNNREANLAALCQKCHLGHDAQQHARNRRYGRYHKRDQLNLFE